MSYMNGLYNQFDSHWSGSTVFGTFKCAQFGSKVCDIAHALYSAGWDDITPNTVMTKLKAEGAWDALGNLDWNKVHAAFPQIHPGGVGFNFIEGALGHYLHTIVEHNGVEFDPYSGTEVRPTGFSATSRLQTVSIDPA